MAGEVLVVTAIGQIPTPALPAENWPGDQAIIQNIEGCTEYWLYNGAEWLLQFIQGNCPDAYSPQGDPNP